MDCRKGDVGQQGEEPRERELADKEPVHPEGHGLRPREERGEVVAPRYVRGMGGGMGLREEKKREREGLGLGGGEGACGVKAESLGGTFYSLT